MDQKKIGAFIAECRKREKLTQRELAEKLGVTDRSVSNWENGACLPDAGLYQSLCDILQISINELFAGEFICEDDKTMADEKLLTLLEHRLYDSSSKEISFDEFHNCLSKMSEVSLLLQRFQDKQEAVKFLVKETGLPAEECASAYDIYRKMFH